MAKKKIIKKTAKKKQIRKAAKKPELTAKPEIPAKTFEQKVIEKLEEEVKKPVLAVEGERREFREKRFFTRKPFRRIEFARGPRYKSHGEHQIAEFLKGENIHFVYEYPLAITDEERKIRIWYPDFWLPELNIIIEYMGMKGKIDYDKASIRKKKIYNALKIDFIEIHPGLLVKGNWKRFIAMKIIEIMRSKSYLYNKMKALAKKYVVPAEEKSSGSVGLEILDQ